MWHRANIEPDDQDIAEMECDDQITTDCCQRKMWRSETMLVDKIFNWCNSCWNREFGTGEIIRKTR